MSALVVQAIIVAAVVLIGVVAIKAMGASIPQWVQQIFWIIVIAAFAILAIRFVTGM